MTLCAQCGSIRIELAQPEGIDRLIAFFTGKRPFVCWRCGWKGRRNWTDDDLKALADYGAGGAEPDPELVALDAAGLKRARRKAQKRGNRKGKSKAKPATDTFGFDALSLTRVEIGALGEEGWTNPAPTSDRPRGTRKPSARREIVTAIAVTTLVMLFVFFVSMAPSCRADGF